MVPENEIHQVFIMKVTPTMHFNNICVPYNHFQLRLPATYSSKGKEGITGSEITKIFMSAGKE
jgi:hypothetical protein